MTDDLRQTYGNIITKYKRMQRKLVFSYHSTDHQGENMILAVKEPQELAEKLASEVSSRIELARGVDLFKLRDGTPALLFKDYPALTEYISTNRLTVDKVNMERELMRKLKESASLLRNYNAMYRMCAGEK